MSDHANDPRWCKKVKGVKPVGPRQWQVTHKPVPLRPAVTLGVEQVELAPPRRLKLREEDDASVFEIEYQLEAVGGGTRFTQIVHFQWKRLPPILHKTFARGVQRDVRGQLRALKRVLECS